MRPRAHGCIPSSQNGRLAPFFPLDPVLLTQPGSTTAQVVAPATTSAPAPILDGTAASPAPIAGPVPAPRPFAAAGLQAPVELTDGTQIVPATDLSLPNDLSPCRTALSFCDDGSSRVLRTETKREDIPKPNTGDCWTVRWRLFDSSLAFIMYFGLGSPFLSS